MLFSKIANGQAVSKPTSSISIFEGTLIRTPKGDVPIESLQVGDRVMTLDGPKPIEIKCKQDISSYIYASDRRNWAVRVRKGALGYGQPKRDTYVLGSQRIMFCHDLLPERLHCDAVMIEARSLCAVLEGVKIENRKGPVTYHQIGFAQEEIIFANGAALGSFMPTSQDLATLPRRDKVELCEVYPQLLEAGTIEPCAYQTIRSWELMSALR